MNTRVYVALFALIVVAPAYIYQPLPNTATIALLIALISLITKESIEKHVTNISLDDKIKDLEMKIDRIKSVDNFRGARK